MVISNYQNSKHVYIAHFDTSTWMISIHIKDRHQWLGREFRYSLSFPKAILYTVYHEIAIEKHYILMTDN